MNNYYNPYTTNIYPYQIPYYEYRDLYPSNYLDPNYSSYFNYYSYNTPSYPTNNNEIDYIIMQNSYSHRLPGDVILSERLGSGGYWKLTNHGNNGVTLQNLGNSRFKGWYLDIDGNTGKTILSERLGSGGYWKLTDNGNNTIILQNLGNSRFKGWYLDIDGNTGNAILSERLGSGGYWKLTDNGNNTIILQNLGNSKFKGWYLDIDASDGGGGGGNELAILTKTIASFDYPVFTPLPKKKRYRVYLEVQVPKNIAASTQATLDKCMEVAKARAAIIIAPFITPATMAGLPGAIPGAIAEATKTFGACIASDPKIYPHINKIKVNIKTNSDA